MIRFTHDTGRIYVTLDDKLIGLLEPYPRLHSSSDWLLTVLDGNPQGKTKIYPELAAAVNALKQFRPWTNEHSLSIW